jgi:AraC family transcriptional regulator
MSASTKTLSVCGREMANGDAGSPWHDLLVEISPLPHSETSRIIPGNRHPEIVQILSGTAVVEEREIGGQWLRTTVKPGDLFLTAPGPSYELKHTGIGSGPYEVMLVALAQPVLARALTEVFGDHARFVHLRDVSGFQDSFMDALLEKLRAEFLLGRRASRLFVRGAADSLAVHLARNYTVTSANGRAPQKTGGLPAFKLRKVTDLMMGNLEDGFCLSKCAAEAGMSEFHFSRMFKRATGKSPSQYFIVLRMEKAQDLLRETRKDVIEIAMDLGYASPSHFAQVFRRETGQSPAEYRRQG